MRKTTRCQPGQHAWTADNRSRGTCRCLQCGARSTWARVDAGAKLAEWNRIAKHRAAREN